MQIDSCESSAHYLTYTYIGHTVCDVVAVANDPHTISSISGLIS